jgi:hypothetical protein
MFEAWRNNLSRRNDDAQRRHRQVTDRLRAEDLAGYADRMWMFRQGRQDALGPDYMATAEEADRCSAQMGVMEDVLNWIENAETAGRRVTLEQVDQEALEIAQSKHIFGLVFGSVLLARIAAIQGARPTSNGDGLPTRRPVIGEGVGAAADATTGKGTGTGRATAPRAAAGEVGAGQAGPAPATSSPKQEPGNARTPQVEPEPTPGSGTAERPRRPTWQESERDVSDDLTGTDFTNQRSFLDGKQVPRGTPGSTRPDNHSRMYRLSVDVKNYDIQTSAGRSRLVKNVLDQVRERARHLPHGTRQGVVLDFRGQQVDTHVVERIEGRIVHGSDGLIMHDDIVVKL